MPRRVQIKGDDLGDHSKQKRNKPPVTGSEEGLSTVKKPGLETNLPHIAQMWIGKDNDLALSLTRHLTSWAAARVGIRRSKHY